MACRLAEVHTKSMANQPPLWVLNRVGSNFTAVPLRVLTAPVYFLYPAIGFGLRLLDKTQTSCLKSDLLLGES